jgi:apolipoprotein N-acyltransferase
MQISAEIFSTRYRNTCHGISAAAGTLGSIVAEVSLFVSSPTDSNLYVERIGWVLVGCSPLLIVAAVLVFGLGSEITGRPQDDS